VRSVTQVDDSGLGSARWVAPKAGDRDTVISELFVGHHGRLAGLTSLLVGDRRTAEDVVQEAFAEVAVRPGEWPRWT
jgi:DNA-directed RNA polymerase specialized sigma24 family protein